MTRAEYKRAWYRNNIERVPGGAQRMGGRAIAPALGKVADQRSPGGTMQRQPVESSNIASVGWDPQTKTMEIEFVGGGVYQYTGGPVEQRYKDLMVAASKGQFFTKHIRRDPNIKVSKVG